MGKRIIQQRRGRGSNTYKVRRRGYKYLVQYPQSFDGKGIVIKLINSTAHTAPLAKVECLDKKKFCFFMPAFKGMVEGQEIELGGKEIKEGNIIKLKEIPIGTRVYNLETRNGDGGKLIKAGGSSAIINRIVNDDVFVILPSKKEKKFRGECRATIGVCAGAGRLEKPFVKAGTKYHLKKSKGKLWPRTSAVKMNAIDHPFGSGRGKVPKPRIAKRNAPPGAKVGLIRPKRTGKKK